MKYIIKKNKHYAFGWIWRIFNIHLYIKYISYEFKFNYGCWYPRESVEYSGINKLCGLGYGFNHHKNSFRIGWQPDFDNPWVIRLYYYFYNADSKSYQSEYLTSVLSNQDIKINIHNTLIEIFWNNRYLQNFIPILIRSKFGFKLYPYFGGKSRAPNDICIYLDRNEKR